MKLPLQILFLCTGNSCRSVIAEALANQLGQQRLRAWSAGSAPTGQVNEHALAVLERHGIQTQGLHSQSWDDFRDRPLDVVITVCGNADAACPVWLGGGLRVHWGLDDPAEVTGDPQTVDQAFEETFRTLERRIKAVVALPLESLSHHQLREELEHIHRRDDSVAL